MKVKPIETAQKKAQDLGYIHNWFKGLRAYYTENNINPDNFWNFNESRVCLSIARNQLVWTGSGRNIYMPHSNNRELVTLVETIQSTGEVIPPIVIISGQNLMEDWFNNLPPSYLLA